MSSRVQVQTRTRPYEPSDGLYDPLALQINGKSITARSGGLENTFRFTHCHDEGTTQGKVFDSVKPIVEHVFQGRNATVFVYGVTGSGKTHTMQGTLSDPGIIPRVVQSIFSRGEEMHTHDILVEMSYVEILNDKVFDLLADDPWARDLKIMDNGSNGLVVGNQIVEKVGTLDDFDSLFQLAAKKRTTGATLLNSSSSRSHAILTVEVKIVDHRGLIVRKGKICLADLAGSENNNIAGNDRVRLQESKSINTSLTVLGKVVEAIVQNQPRVPYRDCKLTRLLSDALGGTSFCLLLCCLAPGAKFSRDTLNTLKFAARTMDIKSTMVGGSCSSRNSSTGPRSSIGYPSAPGPAKRPLGVKYQAGSNLPRTADSWLKPLLLCQKAKAAMYTDPTPSSPKSSPLTERKARILFEEWYEAKRDLERQEAETVKPPVAVSAPLRSLAATTVSAQDVDKDLGTRLLLRDARKYQEKGDLANAILHYEQALSIVPDNKRLKNRIAQLKQEQDERFADPDSASRPLNPTKRALDVPDVFGVPKTVVRALEPLKKRSKGVRFADGDSVRMFST